MKTPEQHRLDTHLTRALRRGLPATLTLTEWHRTVADFHGRCAYCAHADVSVMDHFIPVARGGGTTAGNCLPACEPCNTTKGGKHPDALDATLGAATLAGLRRYLASCSTGVDVVPRTPAPAKRRPARKRTNRIDVPLTDEEWQVISAAAQIGGEDVVGFMRRLALMDARRRTVASGGTPPPAAIGGAP